MSTEVAKVGQGPKIEYFLQGSILENHRELLLNRLKGLCDMAESLPEKFNDHEMVFSLRGPPPTTPIILNVRHALDHPDEPWHLKCVGTFDSGDAGRSTMTRNIVDVGVTSNITQFLSEMGFVMDFEYVARGYVFRKGWLKTTVSKLNKVISPGNMEHLEPQSNFHLVELSVTASQSQDKVAEDMKNFAEQLKPLVVLEKLDYRRLPQ